MEYALHRWLNQHFPDAGEGLYLVCTVGIILITAIALHYVLHYVLLRIFSLYLKESDCSIRNTLHDTGVFSRLVMIFQGAVFAVQTRIWLPQDSDLRHSLVDFSHLWILLFSVLTLFAILNTIEHTYARTETARRLPIRGISQSIKLLSALTAIIFAISIVINKSPLLLLSGLGAMTAILTLVFKDTILGFVSGIQLSANQMLQIGDWVEMPKYNADGDVIEINLTTVKVRNWDKTITTIPAYALTTDSFKNWRGMQESGGRRIKRSIHIDATSVDFLNDEQLEQLRHARLLSGYIEQKVEELETYNREVNADLSYKINGRRLTNLGTFRAYLAAYLDAHPRIHPDMTRMVRQLAPDERGIPLEIYCFTNTVAWKEYESIQSDIFDHTYAIVEYFGLRIFQSPTGYDIQSMASKLSALSVTQNHPKP